MAGDGDALGLLWQGDGVSAADRSAQSVLRDRAVRRPATRAREADGQTARPGPRAGAELTRVPIAAGHAGGGCGLARAGSAPAPPADARRVQAALLARGAGAASPLGDRGSALD